VTKTVLVEKLHADLLVLQWHRHHPVVATGLTHLYISGPYKSYVGVAIQVGDLARQPAEK